ncbi:kinase-like domain-containing protein [Catenaria anguillulae PL171]|uniref:non-specific serine/threonine protein kinase n=1 Tax=Catenaria anguillulae PL171 TaxID=765915 RepID=A0A1Y2I3D6_9FUNG|nr:kinase-like domain-containing protein [Catenaria anguillulae PL171]
MSVPPSPLYLGSPSVPIPGMQSGMTGSSSTLGSQRGRRRSSHHSHKHASGDDIDELLLSEEEAERKRAARKFEVQRCEPNPNSVLRRNTSFRGSVHASPTSASSEPIASTSPHLSPNTAENVRPGLSHAGGGSLLGHLFHTDHASHPSSPSHSPVASPESKPHGTVKRSSSIIDKLDRMMHPDHDNTAPVLPTSSAATGGADSPPASAEPSRSSSPIMGLLTRKKSEASSHSPRAGSAHGSTRLHRSNSESSMNEKYGITKEFLGKGANATVRLAHKLVDKSTTDHHHGHHGHHHHHGHQHGHHGGHHQGHSEHPSAATTRSDATPHNSPATGTGAPTGTALASGNNSTVANDDSSRHSSAGQLSRTMSLSKSSSFSGASEQGDNVVPIERLFAIKKFRKRRKEESEKDYIKKLSAEFCISSSLHHPHVIETVDLIQDEQDQWCEVMEYMPGGDLFARIANGPPMSVGERDCLFAQLIEGVGYLHSIGVAHRDLKPENLLLDADGRTLKIADFGTSEVFRVPWAKDRRRVKGICGSDPYIAPEEWSGNSYEPDLVDVWATGIIFFVMVHKTIPWKAAVKTDPHYANFLETRRTGMFEYIDELPGGEEGPRDLLYEILEPDPTVRPSCFSVS